MTRGARPGEAGATRTCPHCKSDILESAAVCPACGGHLRYDSAVAAGKSNATLVPLKVEGVLRHPGAGEAPWEYSMLLVIRNQRGEEVARKLVGVGALHPGDERTFSLAVEVFASTRMRR
ncbi:MAG: zinc ribbon domain-containing protein [Pseudoxanthomonas suwonensis]|nr:zinc ribbon domain-containing protein [Pseudoxanthomonas suwonensis]